MLTVRHDLLVICTIPANQSNYVLMPTKVYVGM